ncbi:MAG: methylenetetrahydrofolate--tRNA-(uracil(54)-C(5))-methyltransferase (FADH(2)-oxidizing) TrmFO [Planctomycetota bacterium]|nr:MAG: methylenetetrahydrofolate--tRNA-(uracil(54)-C(5))-methyltransferase (FADH(2)-oxidizing) TrmFO [Planctomycetota bacterium]
MTSSSQTAPIPVVGAGLAGSEAALQLAEAGFAVDLFEMRPQVSTPAHQSGDCAELVCSNSLGSALPDRAAGVLQAELAALGCQLLDLAKDHSVPAGQALAVDREKFAHAVTERLESHPKIRLIRTEVLTVPEDPVVILASGPLTGASLSQAIQDLSGEENLSFFDAIAPVVSAESLDRTVLFAASRYGHGEADYLNIPLEKEHYEQLVDTLLDADRHQPKPFEMADPRAGAFFERCMPVEVLAARGRDSLRYGPLRPVGLTDPRTGRRPYAVIQLRPENQAKSLYNLVGFQTHLRYGEQEGLIRSLPGMTQAEFVRLGSMHRNTFVRSPKLLNSDLEWRRKSGLFLAGQITGMEGYLANIGSGLLAGRNAARKVCGLVPERLPVTTLLGALANHVATAPAAHFQPMKAEFGLLPPPDASEMPGGRGGRRLRNLAKAERSRRDLAAHLRQYPLPRASAAPV